MQDKKIGIVGHGDDWPIGKTANTALIYWCVEVTYKNTLVLRMKKAQSTHLNTGILCVTLKLSKPP